MKWHLDAVPELNGYAVEWIEPGRVITSCRNRLYQSETPTGKRQLLGEVKSNSLKTIIAHARLGQRLGRFMVYNAIPLSDGTVFVTFDRQVGLLVDGQYHPMAGLARPFRILRSAVAIGKDGSVYFGEYLSNADRGPLNIYRYDPGSDRASVAHTFTAGTARHIHGVYADSHTDALWCVTGDSASESSIIRSLDCFQTVETVGTGDESWRTVSLLFTNDAVIYATDAEHDNNHIYRLDRHTGERTLIGDIDGPVYYSHAIGDDLFFAVTAELCPSQKLPNATLWHVTSDGKLEQVYSAEKDLVQKLSVARLFMPGTMHFPAGPGASNETYIYGVGLRGIDNKTLRLYHS